jgi:hypothetical protein
MYFLSPIFTVYFILLLLRDAASYAPSYNEIKSK